MSKLAMVDDVGRTRAHDQPHPTGADVPGFAHAAYVIGIGAQKCATSWLYDTLATHKGVSCGPQKELDFFTRRHDRGYTWYEDQFSGPGPRLDFSPSYFSDPACPARLRRFAPRAKLIVVLRDPVERAYSNHLHEIAKGHIPAGPFREAAARNPDYVDQSRYATHLTRWRAHFPAEQILVLIQEEMLDDPAAALRNLCAFLQLDPSGLGTGLEERRNVSDRARHIWLRTVLRRGGDALRRVLPEERLIALKRRAPFRQLLRYNSISLRREVGPLTQDDRQSLRVELAGEVEALRPLLGRERLPWSV